MFLKKFLFGKFYWPSTLLSRLLVDQTHACSMCTSWQHSAKNCKVRSKSKCPNISQGYACGENHHKLLHQDHANKLCINYGTTASKSQASRIDSKLITRKRKIGQFVSKTLSTKEESPTDAAIVAVAADAQRSNKLIDLVKSDEASTCMEKIHEGNQDTSEQVDMFNLPVNFVSNDLLTKHKREEIARKVVKENIDNTVNIRKLVKKDLDFKGSVYWSALSKD